MRSFMGCLFWGRFNMPFRVHHTWSGGGLEGGLAPRNPYFVHRGRPVPQPGVPPEAERGLRVVPLECYRLHRADGASMAICFMKLKRRHVHHMDAPRSFSATRLK